MDSSASLTDPPELPAATIPRPRPAADLAAAFPSRGCFGHKLVALHHGHTLSFAFRHAPQGLPNTLQILLRRLRTRKEQLDFEWLIMEQKTGADSEELTRHRE